MTRKFRAAMIGCGMIAKRLHVPDYLACEDAELVAFCDAAPEKARALAAHFAPDARVYKDYKTLLKEEDLDGVTVALPNYLHAPVTIDALKAGCHVLVEKPMAASAAECQKMIDTAKKQDRMLMVNQSQRLFPAHRKAKEVLESGILGDILHITAMFGHMGPEHWSPTGKWFFDKTKARFGAMADLGVHKADLVRYLSGKEVAEIGAFYTREEKKGTVEDNFVSCLKFKDGSVGTLAASWTVKGMEANYTIFHCTKGSFRVNEIPGLPLVANLVEPECTIHFDPFPPATHYPGSWGLGVSGAFVRACQGQEEPFCSGEEGKKSLEVIFAAEKAAQTGRTVKVPH
jgi:UDP-N-acetylglucosamine 3-dehydrogenase